MNTRSKSVSTNPNPKPLNTKAKEKNSKMPLAKKVEDMTVDEKLNMLIVSVLKLESVPDDIVTIRNSIQTIQTEIKEIPVLKQKLATIESDLGKQKGIADTSSKTVEALEESLTDTQKNVDEFKAQIREFKDKLTENQKILSNLEAKMLRDDKRISDLSKQALEEEVEKSNISTMFQIQGVPENPKENLKLIAKQIIFDTGVSVDHREIDEVYREGTYNKRRTRPIVVTLTKTSTRNEILKNRYTIKRNPNCKDIWLNEIVHEKIRLQRNELHALHQLAIRNGHTSKHVLDTIVINGITYNHSSIHKLPADLTLELAYSREYDDSIYFNLEHVFLSNFHPCTIKLEDASCTSLEQAYFYIMAKDIGNMEIAQLILNTHAPRKIKKLGSSLIATTKWNNKSAQVMFDLLNMKYEQNPQLRKKLITTGNKRLVESTQSMFWGCGLTIPMIDKMKREKGKVKYDGKNTLGSQTEDVRRDIIDSNKDKNV